VLKEGGFEAAEGTLSAWTNKAQDEVPELEVTGVAAILELADRFGWGYVAFESPQDIDFTGIDIDGGVPSFGPEVKWAVLSAGDFGFPHVLTVNPAPSKVLRDPGLPLLQALFEQEQLAKLQEPESLTVTELQLRDRLKEAIAELEQIPEAERLAEKIVVQVREQLVDAERGDPKPALVGEPLESSTGVVLPSGRVLSVSRPFELVTTDAVRADLDLADDRLFLAAEPGAEPSTRTACESLAGGKLAVADGGDAIWASDGSAVVLETLSEGQVLWTFAAADPQQPCAFTRVGALAPTRAGLDGRPVPHTSGKVARVGQASGFGVVTIESVGAAEGGEQLQLGLLEQTQIQQVAWIDGDRLVAIAESQLDGAVSIVLLSVRDPMRVLAFPVSAIEGITDAAAVVPVPGKTSLVLATRWSGKLYRVVSYGLDAKEHIDYDAAEKLALAEKPKLIVTGASAYSRVIDWKRFRAIADKVGALLMADIAHYAGLIAVGLYPSPVGIADFVTTTTHKTLRGPRGGLVMGKPEQEKAVNSAIFPGLQGGPLMHVIAAKAVALGEALRADFKGYQNQVLENARTMAATLAGRGVRIVSGGTDSHLFLMDLTSKNLTGKAAEAVLGRAHMTVNKNAIPNDPQKPTVTSGVRIGSPAMTTRGFRKVEAERLAHLMADVLDRPADEATVARVANEVKALCARFPVYP